MTAEPVAAAACSMTVGSVAASYSLDVGSVAVSDLVHWCCLSTACHRLLAQSTVNP
jgi:hypothetical protein